MEEKKKKKNILFKIILLFLLIYSAFYIASSLGYYENKETVKTKMTKKNIKEFEKDINSGKNVDINDYLTKKVISYENNTSKLGYYVSKFIEFFMIKAIKYTFGILSKLLG